MDDDVYFGPTPVIGRGRGRGGGGDVGSSSRGGSGGGGGPVAHHPHPSSFAHRGRGGGGPADGRGRGRGRGGSSTGGGGGGSSTGGTVGFIPAHAPSNPHGFKAFSFNYALLERRIYQHAGPSYTAVSPADLAEAQRNKQQASRQLPPRPRVSAPGGARWQAQPRGPEEDPSGAHLAAAQRRSAGGVNGSIMDVFGKRITSSRGALAARPLNFVPATGDWVNGVFVALNAPSQQVTEQPRQDVAEIASQQQPVTEEQSLAADALRPQGAGLGFGRPRNEAATKHQSKPVDSNAAISDTHDSKNSSTAPSRVEREQEMLLQRQRDQAESLLQDLIRGYTSPPRDPFSSSGFKRQEKSSITSDDLPFASHNASFIRPSATSANNEPTIIKAQDADIEGLVTGQLEEAEAQSSPQPDAACPEQPQHEDPKPAQVSLQPSTSAVPLVPQEQRHQSPTPTVRFEEPLKLQEDSTQLGPKVEEATATPADSDDDAAEEFDLSAMQSFVRSMDGQSGGRTVDMIDIAVEDRIKEEEAWLSESDSDHPQDAKTSADLGAVVSKDDDAGSQGSSADGPSSASDDSTDLAAEQLGRQRLANKQNERVDVHWGDTDDDEDEDDIKDQVDGVDEEEEDDDDDDVVEESDEDDEDLDGEDDDDEDYEDEDDDDSDEDEEDIEGAAFTYGKGSSSQLFSWVKSDKEFYRQLETYAKADASQISNSERKERKRLFKAIARGELFIEEDSLALEEFVAEALGRDASKPRKKGKSRQFDDTDIFKAELELQWKKDRQVKAVKKAARQAEREAAAQNPFIASHGLNLGTGKLSKKAAKVVRRAELKGRAALGLDDFDEVDSLGQRFAQNLVELNEQLTIFVNDDTKTALSLPPMDKTARARVHELASAYHLVSKSQGTGNKRFTVITKGKASNHHRSINWRKINHIVYGAYGGGSLGRQLHGGSRARSGKEAPARSSRNIEGAEVGFGADKVGEGNVGHKLLKIMGWNEGAGIGVIEGGAEPISATVKTRKGGLGF